MGKIRNAATAVDHAADEARALVRELRQLLADIRKENCIEFQFGRLRWPIRIILPEQ